MDGPVEVCDGSPCPEGSPAVKVSPAPRSPQVFVLNSTVHTLHHNLGEQSSSSSPVLVFGKGTLYHPGSTSSLPSRNHFPKQRQLLMDSQKKENRWAGR